MQIRILSFFFVLMLPTITLAQEDSIAPELRARAAQIAKIKLYNVPDPKPYAEQILPAQMAQLINDLASDSMAGRETGTEGQRMAARYIARRFEQLGLKKVGDRSSYFQEFKLLNERWITLEVQSNTETWRNLRDYYIIPSSAPDSFDINAKDLVYLGYGIDSDNYSDYKKVKIKGKAVVVEAGEPLNQEGINAVTGTAFRTEWSFKVLKKAEAAAKHGATCLVYIDPKFEENLKANRREYAGYGWTAESTKQTMPIPVLYISQKAADVLLGGNNASLAAKKESVRKGTWTKSASVGKNLFVKARKEVRTLEGSNVVGLLEGADELAKEEYIILTAHYDHLGEHNGLVYNGADDNASGTAGVIEMAESFVLATRAGIRPKRSILFMLVSGEEKGLLGSEFYTNFPIFPLSSTVCNINSDMIGRIDAAHTGDPDYIYVIGSDRLSTELHQINEDMNNTYTKLKLDYTYNDPNDPNRYYERSDQYNFAKNGIPCIFYFNGTHADYHKPTDTADKINAEAAAKRTQLAFYTAWEIAHKPTRILVDKK